MEKKNLDLIIAVVNDGFSSEVLKYANEIASVSATIVKGRGTQVRDDIEEKSCTYSEKESVFIVVKREDKNKIMETLSNHVGLGSNAQGMIFSLPVDDFAENEDKIAQEIKSEKSKEVEENVE